MSSSLKEIANIKYFSLTCEQLHAPYIWIRAVSYDKKFTACLLQAAPRTLVPERILRDGDSRQGGGHRPSGVEKADSKSQLQNRDQRA